MTQATHLVIENFRLIGHAELSLDEVTVLSGRNNAGKTTALEALRVLYKDRPWDARLDRPRRGCDADTKVSLAFDDGAVCTFVAAAKGAVSWQVGDGKEGKGPLGHVADGELIYVPSHVRVDEVSKTTGASPFRDLLSGAVASAAGDGSGVATKLLEASQLLEQDDDVRDLLERLNAGLDDWDIGLHVGVAPPTPADVVKQWMRLEAVDDGRAVPLESLGSGAQRAVSFSLIEALAEVDPYEELASPRLLLFEEPEAFLHPSQVDALRRSLHHLAESGRYQPILTTHSPRVLSARLDDLTQLIRFECESGVSTAFQLDDDDLKELLATDHLDGDMPDAVDEERQQLEELKLAHVIGSARSHAFFARRVLLVEGFTETALFTQLVEDGKLQLPADTEVIDALGKFNLPRLLGVFARLGISGVVVYDKDAKNAAKPKHAFANQRIEELVKDHGWRQVAFEQNLEVALGVGSGDQAKPVEMVQAYRLGSLDQHALDGLCKELSKLFGELA